MSGGSDTGVSRGVGPVFGGLRRAIDRVSEGISARPFSLVVFVGSIALLVYLQTSSLSSFRVDAVVQAQAVDHPARVSSFVVAVYVLPGDTVDVGAPLVELSPHFIDRELAQIDAEVEKLLQESQLAQARLLVEEQRWLSPSMRLRPDRPSLERPTEALYAKQLGVLQTRRHQLLEDRRGLTIASSHTGRVVRVAPPSCPAAGNSVASVVAEYADEIVAYVLAETDPAQIATGAPV
jgi:multidrug efflux pump subunit AcrA (membrane-fusion protein)